MQKTYLQMLNFGYTAALAWYFASLACGLPCFYKQPITIIGTFQQREQAFLPKDIHTDSQSVFTKTDLLAICEIDNAILLPPFEPSTKQKRSKHHLGAF